jgi:YNFM family putative membrane transporter
VSRLVQSLGQTGIALTGGIAMGLAFFVLAIQPNWWPAPFAVIVIGLGFYMMHNTLQTVATQMTPEARGTSIALFASVYFQGQTVGVAVAAPIMDRFGGPVLFTISAVLLPLLAFWFIRRLKKRT